MNKIYIFGGLGADKRIFEKIDFGNLDIEFIDWIEPLDNENIKNYVRRISEKLISPNPILLGVSFGGILTVELSKILDVKKVILIASVKNKDELPKFYRIAGQIKLNKLIPTQIFKRQNFITNWFFGISSKSEELILKSILIDINVNFLKWAINEIVNWRNEISPKNLVHIHGNMDRIIPLKTNMKVDFIIDGGGHFMTMNKSQDIEKIIKNLCS